LQVYEDAAENTANILSESWMCWANGQAAISPTDGEPCADICPDTEQKQPLQNATPSLQEHNVV